MRSAIGNSLLLYLVVIFSGIIILFFVGIISYSKAYGVKNRIIEIIEKYGGYNTNAVSEINSSLSEMGYNVASSNFCSGTSVIGHMNDMVENSGEEESYVLRYPNSAYATSYNYCVFEVRSKTTNVTGSSNYYVVVAFVNFNFPVIGNVINIPIYGETKILNRSYDY